MPACGPAHVKALAAVLHGAHEDRLERPVVVARVGLGRLVTQVGSQVLQIENGGRELVDLPPVLVSHVAGHRERLQVDFRPHDRGAEVQQHAALQLRDGLGEDQEIAIGSLAQGRAIAVRVLVDDVIAEPDVDGDRHAQAVAGGQDADVRMREGALGDAPGRPPPHSPGRRVRRRRRRR